MNEPYSLLARQPIFDDEVRVSAYEILFRLPGAETAEVTSPDHATAAVAVHALLDLGLDRLVGGRSAWINIPRNVLVSGIYNFLPPERVVLELLETIEADEDVLRAIGQAKSMGFKIALDDFVLNERTAALVPFADFIKLDVLAVGSDRMAAEVSRLRRPGLRLVAEKVETQDVFRESVRAGCNLFQGYFFARPSLIKGRVMPNNRLSLLRIVGSLQDSQARLEEIEALVHSDVGLSYRLLRYVNSVAIGMVSPIQSLHHAIMTLGLDRVRVCVLVLLLTAGDDKPDELVAISLIRARYCQLLCEFQGLDGQRGFLVGLLSAIDAFLDRELEYIVREMGLDREVAAALIAREGELGDVLQAAIACESADFDRLSQMRLSPTTLRDTYLAALSWSSEMQSTLTGR